MDEVFGAMADLRKEGLVRALGASNMFAWQLAEYNTRAEERSLPRIDSMQGHYNLIHREEEREMIPYCKVARYRPHTLFAPCGRAAYAHSRPPERQRARAP